MGGIGQVRSRAEGVSGRAQPKILAQIPSALAECQGAGSGNSRSRAQRVKAASREWINLIIMDKLARVWSK